MRHLSSVFAAVVVVAAGCAAVGPLPPARVSGWYQMTSPGFALTTNLPAAKGEELIRDLELMRAGIWSFVWPGYRAPRAQMSVVAMRLADLHEFQPRTVSGYRAADEIGSLIVVGVDSDHRWERTAHELAHELGAWMWPFQPLWLAEGLSTYLETVQHSTAGAFTFGRANGRRQRSLLTRGAMSMKRLLSLSSITGDPDAGWFEDSAWLLYHYLVNRRPGELGRLQERLVRLEPWRQAWQAELPDLTPARLDAELEEYLRRSGYTLLVKPFAGSGPAPTPSVRALSAAEAHAAMARVALHSAEGEGNIARAAANVQRALALQPDGVLPLALSFYHLPDATEARRKELATRATRVHPESWLAWMMLSDANAGEDRALAREALRRANRLAPEEPRIWERLAVIEAASGRWREAVACSSRALRLGTPSPPLLAVHAAAAFNLGHCAGGADATAAFLQNLPRGKMPSTRKQLADLASRCVEGSGVRPSAGATR